MECQKDFLRQQLATVVTGMHTHAVIGNCIICLLMCLDIWKRQYITYHCYRSWLLCWCIGLVHLSPWGKVRCSNPSCDTPKTWKQEVILYHQTISHWLWMSREVDLQNGCLMFLSGQIANFFKPSLWHSVTFSYKWKVQQSH